jgi:tryptophanyl-tRNA synthetase
MVVPGTDGRKMSKSYGNVLPVFTDEVTLRKRIMGIKTDSTPLEAPKELDGSLVGQLFALFTTDEEYLSLKQRMLSGGLGWGHAKDELFQVIWREIGPVATRFWEIREDEALLRSVVTKSRDRVQPIADATMTRVRQAVGII